MIVKLQRALFPPDGPVLIYSEDRAFEMYAPLDGQLQTVFDVFGLKQSSRAKVFAEAHMDRKQRLVIDEVFERDLGW